jgi:hypothetical protein
MPEFVAEHLPEILFIGATVYYNFAEYQLTKKMLNFYAESGYNLEKALEAYGNLIEKCKENPIDRIFVFMETGGRELAILQHRKKYGK